LFGVFVWFLLQNQKKNKIQKTFHEKKKEKPKNEIQTRKRKTQLFLSFLLF
jgi:hypothetical protein